MTPIVNKLSILFFLMSPLVSESKPETWPGVDYSYVRVYLYNTESELNAHHSPVKQGNQLDSTILKPGSRLHDHEIRSLLEIANQKKNGLLIGLSACYIPHHAFIFFNDEDTPVAYMSFCAECQGIRLWPYREMNIRDLSKRLVRSAETNAEVLSGIIRNNQLPIHQEPQDYKQYTTFLHKGLAIVHLDSLTGTVMHGFSLEHIRKQYPDTLMFDIQEYERVTAGGDTYRFTDVFVGSDTLHFYGTGNEAILSEGTIHGSDFTLLNTVRVGLSAEETMQATFLNATRYSGITAIEIRHTSSGFIHITLDNNRVNKIIIHN